MSFKDSLYSHFELEFQLEFPLVNAGTGLNKRPVTCRLTGFNSENSNTGEENGMLMRQSVIASKNG